MRHMGREPFRPGGPFRARTVFWFNGKKFSRGDSFPAAKVPKHRQATLFRAGYIDMRPAQVELPGFKVPETRIVQPKATKPKAPRKKSKA